LQTCVSQRHLWNHDGQDGGWSEEYGNDSYKVPDVPRLAEIMSLTIAQVLAIIRYGRRLTTQMIRKTQHLTQNLPIGLTGDSRQLGGRR
jgi:hypothetical protein